MTVSYTVPAEVPSRLGFDVGGEVRPRIGHREDDAVDRKPRIEVVANEVDGGQQLGQSLQGVVLTLERDEDRIGSGQGVHGQQTERWRAIDEDDVVVVAERLEEPA